MGHVILINGCAIIWKSALIDAICMSTMMAEYYALSASLREALPLRTLIERLSEGFGIDPRCDSAFKTTVWEDNMGALTLANLDPGQHASRSKFYDVKAHWFRSHLSEDLTVEKIDTKLQLADIFTKDLPPQDFKRLRKMLCGW